MIFGNIRNEKEFSSMEEKVRKCLEYARENDLLSYELGTHKIDGDNFFVNVVSYETTAKENRIWEAHRQYLDIHLILDGTEQIDLNFIENMEQGEFVEKDDFLPLNGKENSHVELTNGDFLVCYPHDAHRTAIQVGAPAPLKKAIFKVKI